MTGSDAEPDARIVLANERTFLAWVRTAVGLLAAGTALASIPLTTLDPWFRFIASAILLLAGLALPWLAWFTWRRSRAAIRQQEPLPEPTLTWILAAAVSSSGVLILVGVLVRR